MKEVRINPSAVFHAFASQDREHAFLPIEILQATEQFVIGDLLARRHAEEEMEVIGHHAISDGLDAQEASKFEEETERLVLVRGNLRRWKLRLQSGALHSEPFLQDNAFSS
ncbi:MAG: hypothetical protein KIT22_05350 [Verrucomicrobiae bacterium]|nr:hypothetical protein [Verrucomicrobiae bacterium]